MSVYIELDDNGGSKVCLVTSFQAVTKLFGSPEVQISYDPGKMPHGFSDIVRLPFLQQEFRQLFQEAAKSNEILDVRKENWENLRQKLTAGTQATKLRA